MIKDITISATMRHKRAKSALPDVAMFDIAAVFVGPSSSIGGHKRSKSSFPMFNVDFSPTGIVTRAKAVTPPQTPVQEIYLAPSRQAAVVEASPPPLAPSVPRTLIQHTGSFPASLMMPPLEGTEELSIGEDSDEFSLWFPSLRVQGDAREEEDSDDEVAALVQSHSSNQGVFHLKPKLFQRSL